MNERLLLFLLCLFGLLSVAPAMAEAPTKEKAKIQKLIDHVRGLEDATFIRNGKEHDAATAAEFLRRKWRANTRSVNSAEDFITVAGTGSSTTGKPYIIRLGSGKSLPCGEYLAQQLKKIE